MALTAAGAIRDAVAQAGSPLLTRLVRPATRWQWEEVLAAAVAGAALVELSAARGPGPALQAKCDSVCSELAQLAGGIHGRLRAFLFIVHELLGNGTPLPEAIGTWVVAEAERGVDPSIERGDATAIGMLVLATAATLAGTSARLLLTERSTTDDQSSVERLLLALH